MITTAAQALTRLGAAGAMTLVAAPRSRVPSLVGEVVGAPVKGSWWGHPKGKLIFTIATALEDAPDVVVAKLVGGRVTFLHRRHAAALVRVVTDPTWREARAARLTTASRTLLAEVERRGVVRFADKDRAPARKPLEALALVHAASEHTEAGHHGMVFTSWKRWAKAVLAGVARPKTLAAALAELAQIGVTL